MEEYRKSNNIQNIPKRQNKKIIRKKQKNYINIKNILIPNINIKIK